MTNSLDQASLVSLKGVGPALAEKLARIGILTLQDVLFHLPLRYEDRTRITPIGNAHLGSTVVIEGQVVSCDVTYGRRRSLLVQIRDDTGKISLRFFHFSKAQQNSLKAGAELRCFGEVRRGAAGLEMYHPEYSTSFKQLEENLTPVYPSTEGITQQRYRNIVRQVLDLMLAGKLLENLGGNYPLLGKTDINSAIVTVHNPSRQTELSQLQNGTHPSQQRLAFEELLSHHLSMRLIRQEMLRQKAPMLSTPATTFQQLKANLGFQLTTAQQKVVREISADMVKPSPMLRLIQGDVGSGKTVVAALASVHAAENNLQTAIMAPTEILAEQHYSNFTTWLEPLGLKTAWLSGKIKGKKRNEQLTSIETGHADVVIGTHALFQKDVTFMNLGLVIIDEQHRFGVHQRLAIREKGTYGDLLPHQLVMTATPIPRTLTMSLYADMDCSVIDELPPGRTPITTSVLPDNRRDEVIRHIESACGQKAQAYWVCTLIEESEVLQCQAAESTAEQLKITLPSLNIGLIHGRMSSAQKTQVMSDFKLTKIDLLVATTVIEVGVDVPNANLMVIENPERLGLAQLHQLRGRIGRGRDKSFCVLLYHPPLGPVAKQRLNVMRESQDGFYIAEKDLQIRGPGELFGSRQSGAMQFKLADLMRDAHMLKDVRQLADDLLENDKSTAYALMDRWLTKPEELSQV